MKLVLLGAPGSGKGTQGERIAKNYGIPQLSTGEILRSAIKNGTPLGKKAEVFMNKGELVTNELVLDLMSARVDEPDCKKGYILDGFPRTIEQAKGLADLLTKKGTALDAVINIDVSDDEVIKRLSGRRMCSKCGAIFHVAFSPSSKGAICDKCGGELYQRDDDKEGTILNRMKVYKEKTKALIDFYKKELKNIDGSKNPADVFKDICSLIDKVKGSDLV